LAALSPIPVTDPQSGLSFSKAAGQLYRPLSADENGHLLLWDREFISLLDLEPELAEFLAVPVYQNGGERVVFSMFERGKDVLTETRGIDQGARLPRNLYRRLCAAADRFRRRLEAMELTDSQQGFVRAFALPDPRVFPSAYRVRQAGLFSRKKLYVLWGMVPETPRAQPTLRMGADYFPDQASGRFANQSSEETAIPVHDRGQTGSEDVAYDEESEWPRWIQLLIWILGFIILLATLGLLISLLLVGCEDDSRPVENQTRQLIPATEERIAELKKQQKVLSDESDSAVSRERVRAVEKALRRQEQALEADRALSEAQARAEAAEKKAESSNSPANKKHAEELKQRAESLKKENDIVQKTAEESFRTPQESDRRDRLEALELKREIIEAEQEYKAADAKADDAQAKAEASGDSKAKQAAEELRKTADELKADAEAARSKAQDSVKSPQLRQELEALREATPQELQEIEDEYKDLNSKRYVMPKNSPAEGEVLVRRFKPDQIVRGSGLRMYIEAEANGRREFKVKGWRLGIGPLVENPRLEAEVPVGPDLDIDVPLDLSFEYRGSDGEIHQDTAPFTLEGEVDIVPRVKINKYKENSQPEPKPAPKFNLKSGA
jgi:hypothetical protein